MTTTRRRVDLGLDDARRLAGTLARDLRDTRIALGLSQAAAGRASGMSASQWSRLEKGGLARPDLVQLSCGARALGLRAHVQLLPAGSPVRDAGQLRLLDRLQRALGAPLRLTREVPLPVPGDLRAWDGCLDGSTTRCFLDAEARIGDMQALERRLRLKARDDPRAAVVVLLCARTRHNVAVLAEHRESVRDLLPLDGPAILRAVRAGRCPPASGILLL